MVLDILGAWAGVDVFLVSIAATVFEIGKLSQQIIGQNCVLVDDVCVACGVIHARFVCFEK